MLVRCLLICFLIARSLLGWPCAADRALCGDLAAESDECCMSGTACCDVECGDSTLESLLCSVICSGCEGRLPPLCPFHSTERSASGWMISIIDPIGFTPIWSGGDLVQAGIMGARVVPPEAWIERLRPTVCIWII